MAKQVKKPEPRKVEHPATHPAPRPAVHPGQGRPAGSTRAAGSPAHITSVKPPTTSGGTHPKPKPKPRPAPKPPPPLPPRDVGGYTPSQRELDQINIAFSVGYRKHCNERVMRALSCLGFAENSWNPDTCNQSHHCGVFQLNTTWQRMHDYHDTAYWTAYALEQGFYGGYGGLITIDKKYPNDTIGMMVQRCQGAGYSGGKSPQEYYQEQVPISDQILAVYGPRASIGGPPSITPVTIGGGGTHVEPASFASEIEQFDSSGLIDQTFKNLRGGANEAAHMAQEYVQTVGKITTIRWR